MNQKINHASSMIIEDHLNHVLNKRSAVPVKKNTGLLPRALHSAFGDFPGDYMPKKGGATMTVDPIPAAEISIAAKQTSKFFFHRQR